MKKKEVRTGDWVIVCDGRKALIMEVRGDSTYPNLHILTTRERTDFPARDINTDRPGRVHASVGSARSSVEQADPHVAAEDKFLVELARDLLAEAEKSEVRRLIIVAAPRALGTLRKTWSPALKKMIVREIDGDWVNMPIVEIEKRLAST